MMNKISYIKFIFVFIFIAIYLLSTLHTTSGRGIILTGEENVHLFAGAQSSSGDYILKVVNGHYILDLGYISPGFRIVYKNAFALVNENPYRIKIVAVNIYPGYRENVFVFISPNTTFPYWIAQGDRNPLTVKDSHGMYIPVKNIAGLYVLNTTSEGSNGTYYTLSNFVWFSVSIEIPKDSSPGKYSGKIVIVISH